MPRPAFASLVVAALAAAALGQPLQQQSPFPTGINLGGVAFVSPTHGFLVGDNHTLIETLDGGLTWISRMNTGLSSDPFYTITFPSPTHGYIAGNNQDAYRTTNGGQTWQQMTSMPGGSVRVLDFITPTTGFAGYNGACVYTPDGGTTWDLRGFYPDCPIMFGMDFRDADVGLASGIRSTPHNDGGLYRTTDGGRTWALVVDSEGGINDVLWISETSVIAIRGQTIIRSDDEGLTWYDYSFSVIDTGLSDIARAGQTSNLAGVSGVGDIWYSWDLGQSWIRVIEGIGVLPANWAINFSDELNGWVVGANGLTYKTVDGGANWQLMNNGCGDQITDIDFFDDNFGVAVTHNGFVLRTSDGGRHWDVKRVQETGLVFGRAEGLQCVHVVDPFTIYVAGQGGIIFRSFDSGNTWQSIGYPFSVNGNYTIYDIQMIDEATGYITGMFGDSNLMVTNDAGFSWTPITGPRGSGVALERRGDRIWVATAADVIDRSFNAGQTWTRVTVPGNFVGITDMQFASENIGYAVSRYGNISKTTNGGVSWVTTSRSIDESYYSVSVVSATEVWIMGVAGPGLPVTFYLRTTNGGQTWTRTNVPLGYAEELTQLCATPSGRAWMAGNFGRIMYRPAPPLTVALPSVPATVVAPGASLAFAVRITPGEEQIAAADLLVRAAPSRPYTRIALTSLGDNNYQATLPTFVCGDSPQCYIEATGSAGTTVRFPATAPNTPSTVRVGVFENRPLLATGFDAGLDTGWSMTGLWHVGTACSPAGACSGSGGGNRAYFGQDSTCNFNTGARVAGVLRSPTVTLPSLLPGQNITIAFCSALDNEYPVGALGDDDQAILWWVAGADQRPIEWFTDHASMVRKSFNINQYAGQTGRFEWRFDSMNTYMNAFRGWHVDDIALTAPVLVCDLPPACAADLNADGTLNADDLADFINCFFAVPACPQADFNADTDTNADDLADYINAYFAGCP